MTNAVTVGEDIHRHEKGGASLPVCEPRGGVLRGVRGETSRDLAKLFGFLTSYRRWAEAGL